MEIPNQNRIIVIVLLSSKKSTSELAIKSDKATENTYRIKSLVSKAFLNLIRKCLGDDFSQNIFGRNFAHGFFLGAINFTAPPNLTHTFLSSYS